MLKHFFTLRRHPLYLDKYQIVMTELCPYQDLDVYVIFARLLGISYANCLRLMRDQFDAQLIGRYQTEVDVLLDSIPDIFVLIRLMNTRLSLILDEKRAPYNFKQEADGSITRTNFDGTNETNSGTAITI